ncbi:MAG: hypothetical protein ACJ8DG_21375 [Microvirga sp.]
MMAKIGRVKRRSRAARPRAEAALATSSSTVHAAVLEEVRRAGLLGGGKTAHVSFRAPPALVEAAKRETGVNSPTDLGILALAVLAQPDPVAEFMKRTRGRLGADHRLDY